ncbi:MAG: OmpA family protein [Bacteroidota bacterium]|jgi:outer membrane protein OmpA-like peptidoglycan-associated protein/tetratricopeptide (TPR) repeat protein|nr:PD40 domain-containing protein [Bacteroidales bacterium]MDI9536224.1 OmpA family protein [Bacteroidota bacterium]OQC45966.1 MAG: putative lipoprotein YiaD precursor [Bacteroidetes bacterium ADurb.Bin028]NLP21161.1 OmpA family protein [Bacteroidales bacterium]HNY44112.1 OmpA family protein [Bacteroidales bacterium]
MRQILVILIFCVISVLSYSQVDVKFTPANFPNKKEQLKVARSQIKNADIYVYSENKIEEGLKLYLKANEFNPNNSDLNFKIGYCYYNSSQKYDCLEYFKKAYELNPKVDKKIEFYLARGYHFNYDFDKAISLYSSYLQDVKDKVELEAVGKHIAECRNGKELVKDTVKVEIINLGENINTEYREYGPMVVADGSKLYFTSRRKGSTGGQVAPDGMFFEDIYESNKTEDGWTKARSVGSPLNTKLHDAVVGISPDGQTMYIYMDTNGGDIYETKLKGSRWSKPTPLKGNVNTKYHESMAGISYDNKTLYFISDNPATSIGGRDIFYATLDKNGNWSSPVNLGPVVNTPYDEVDFFLHPDGRTMYFCSKGHNSMGGLDIFKTVKNADGEWTTPVNLGYPINTPLDDAFYVTTASGTTAYYASVRPEGYGLLDLYELKYHVDKETQKEEDKVLVTLVKGVVRDATTTFPLEAKIEIIDNSIDEVIAEFITNSQTGGYLINLPSGKNYGLNVSKEGYLFHSENFNIADTAEYNEAVIDVNLQRIEVGITVVLKNIFFDYDRATLRPESFAELNRVLAILNDQPKLKIEISGHTDDRGSLEYNKKLSRERAQSVVDYLIEKGVDKNRLTYEGYAFEKPIATNETDEGRQMNRRVEFKVIAH